MVCDCLVELSGLSLEKTFTYKIKEEQLSKIKVGMRVLLPFSHQELEGFVLNIRETSDVDTNLKEAF